MNTPGSHVTRRRFLTIAGLGGAALAAGSFRAFGQSEAPAADIHATLTVFDFGDANAQKVYKDAIARFNKRYPNVAVRDDYSPFPQGWGQYINNLRTRVASGLVPDVVAIAIEGVRATVAEGLMVPLDDYIASDPDSQTYLKDVAPALHDALKVGGKNRSPIRVKPGLQSKIEERNAESERFVPGFSLGELLRDGEKVVPSPIICW
jgi:ABC-type glycerol-3-phosphate transport system substrate-binding protein